MKETEFGSTIRDIMLDEERRKLMITGNWQRHAPDPIPDYEKIDRLLQEFVGAEYMHVARTIGGSRLEARQNYNSFEMLDVTTVRPSIRLLTGGGVSGPGEEFIEISCKTSGMNVLDIVEQLLPNTHQWSESLLLGLLYCLGESSTILTDMPDEGMKVTLKVIIAKRIDVAINKWTRAAAEQPRQFLYSKEIKVGDQLTLELGSDHCGREFGRYAAMFCAQNGPCKNWLKLSTKYESILVHSAGVVGFSRPENVAELFPGNVHAPIVPDLVRMLFPEAKFFLDGGDNEDYPTFENYFTQNLGHKINFN